MRGVIIAGQDTCSEHNRQAGRPLPLAPHLPALMPLYHNPRPRGSQSTGKFQRRPLTGIETSHGQAYRGWTYQLVHHRQGTTAGQPVFNVSISDRHGFRAGYLTGFRSAAKATQSAREWIDEQLAQSSWA